MNWNTYQDEEEDTRLTLSEIRTVVRYAGEGGNVRRDNLKAACDELVHMCREIANSGSYQSLKSVPYTRSRMESDLAYLVHAYQLLLEAAERAVSNAGEEDSVEKRFHTNLNANYRNLLKVLEKWSADFIERLENIPPSGPQDLKIFGRHSDDELDRLIKDYKAAGQTEPLAPIAQGLLKKREELINTLETVSHQKTVLQHEDLMKGLVAVLEGLERVRFGFEEFMKSDTVRGLMKAVDLLRERYEDLLNKHGCYRMDVEGNEYDLNQVEIVERKHTLRHKHKHVSKVLSHGFIYRGKPIKIARVEVATGMRD